MEFTKPLQLRTPLIRGPRVRAAQLALQALKIVPPCGAADGVFGPLTRATVEAFQASFNASKPSATTPLAVSGIIDRQTWDALFTSSPPAGATSPILTAGIPASLAADIPITQAQTVRLKQWMTANFKPQIDATIAPPVDFDLVCAIAAKESAIYWIGFIDRIEPADLLPLCVFDASGDYPGTSRTARPQNAAALRADPQYGSLTDMLIAASNETRRVLHGWGPAPYLYKGYGLFQYDLQNLWADPAFFVNKLWGDFAACLQRFNSEMNEKLRITHGNLHDAVRAYNGSGDTAEHYADSVMILRDWCAKAQP